MPLKARQPFFGF